MVSMVTSLYESNAWFMKCLFQMGLRFLLALNDFYWVIQSHSFGIAQLEISTLLITSTGNTFFILTVPVIVFSFIHMILVLNYLLPETLWNMFQSLSLSHLHTVTSSFESSCRVLHIISVSSELSTMLWSIAFRKLLENSNFIRSLSKKVSFLSQFHWDIINI